MPPWEKAGGRRFLTGGDVTAAHRAPRYVGQHIMMPRLGVAARSAYGTRLGNGREARSLHGRGSGRCEASAKHRTCGGPDHEDYGGFRSSS